MLAHFEELIVLLVRSALSLEVGSDESVGPEIFLRASTDALPTTRDLWPVEYFFSTVIVLITEHWEGHFKNFIDHAYVSEYVVQILQD